MVDEFPGSAYTLRSIGRTGRRMSNLEGSKLKMTKKTTGKTTQFNLSGSLALEGGSLVGASVGKEAVSREVNPSRRCTFHMSRALWTT